MTLMPVINKDISRRVIQESHPVIYWPFISAYKFSICIHCCSSNQGLSFLLGDLNLCQVSDSAQAVIHWRCRRPIRPGGRCQFLWWSLCCFLELGTRCSGGFVRCSDPHGIGPWLLFWSTETCSFFDLISEAKTLFKQPPGYIYYN